MANKNKPMTVAEAGQRGGKARAKRYSREQLREWARKGGWPKGRPRKTEETKPEGAR
jgi:general stress protein YciG